ncbi:chromosomal replication initiator protein DnaA [Leuconostocaceae bacterium ESL0958]|nr:chromosomal replication initiator protein DnaA [Leuconostocaceae bacterium ESL0958]
MVDITKDQLWNQLQARFFKKLGTVSYESFVDPITPVALEEAKMTLAVPVDMVEPIETEWRDRLAMTFVEEAMNLTGSFIKPEIIADKPSTTTSPSQTTETPNPQQATDALAFDKTEGLDPHFSFETFVSGSGNENALAIAQAVAEGPGQVYNPYVIYGGVGLGKTHLMQAIGNAYAKSNPGAKIKYATAEDFMNDYTESLRNGGNSSATAEFRAKYRTLDMLLIDDIQFWTGKHKSQEEFFNTFNTLDKANKQIVMTSDRYPTQIPDLLDRLTSRFEVGISQDIQKPDLPTRVAILRNLRDQNELDELDMPNEVLDLIAERTDSNVRTLTGAYHKFEARIRYMNQPADLATANRILEEMNQNEKQEVTVERIQEVVAGYYAQTVEEMRGKSRKSEIAYARHVAIYLSRTMTDKSLPALGELFGGRDHSSISHGYNKIADKVEADYKMKELINDLAEEIKSGQ